MDMTLFENIEESKEPCGCGFVVKNPSSTDIYLVRVGNDHRPASMADIEDVRNLIHEAFSTDGGKAIVTHHAVDIVKIR